MSVLLQRLAEVAPSSRVAVVDERGPTTFADLVARAERVASTLRGGGPPLGGRRVVLLARADADWVAGFLGVLVAGGVAVPLSPAYPSAELAWFAGDCGADQALVSDDLAGAASELARGRTVHSLAAAGARQAAGTRSEWTPAAVDDPALILYTSGTTGRPKGAALTHANLDAQTSVLRAAWGITPDDRLLHALPLHHLHGLVVALLNALLAGASARMLPRFDGARVAAILGADEATVWMAVPTMYARLRELTGEGAAALRAGARRLRLATSGSAALPPALAAWWGDRAGAIPLERFGMTEVGIALSNPLDPSRRQVGSVGHPLPTVEIRVVDEDGGEAGLEPGELWVRGPSVFAGYWGRPDATDAALTADRWFRTGDVVQRGPDGAVRIVGRRSVDILKSGGYKLSALEIEHVLADHPAIAEVAIVGLPDEAWGERVVAAVVPRADAPAAARDPEAIRAWARERMASYKVPRAVVFVDALPRNALGKVLKPELARRLAGGGR